VEIGEQLQSEAAIVSTICRQLQLADLLIQDPIGGQFRYDINSPNSQLQEKVERALVDYPELSIKLNRPPTPGRTNRSR
jgi:hypothetical protein